MPLIQGTDFIDLDTPSLIIICDGNSITAGQSHASELATRDPFRKNQTRIINAGVGGQTTPDMIARAPVHVDPFISKNAPTIVIALEIGNHLGSTPAREAVNSFWDYCDGRRRKGAYVLACTLHDRVNSHTTANGTTPSQMREVINQVNNLLRSEWRSNADALFDVRTVKEAAGVTSRYFPDGIHPNQALDVLVTDAMFKTLERIPRRRLEL